jgi:tripartite-type tricarboxylate transporter receptor subunit TctC
MTIVARPTLEANDYKQLSAWVLSQKDRVNLGNAGIGSASHLCGLLWQSSMRTEMTTINYKGVSMAMTDLLGGQIDVLCDQTTNTLSYIEGRKIKAYAVTSNKRLPQAALKDLPTLQESGLKGFQVSVWHAVYAPKGLPPETKTKLYAALRSVLSDAAFIQKQEAILNIKIEKIGNALDTCGKDNTNIEKIEAKTNDKLYVFNFLIILCHKNKSKISENF